MTVDPYMLAAFSAGWVAALCIGWIIGHARGWGAARKAIRQMEKRL